MINVSTELALFPVLNLGHLALDYTLWYLVWDNQLRGVLYGNFS